MCFTHCNFPRKKDRCARSSWHKLCSPETERFSSGVLNRVSALPKSVLSGMQDWLGSQRMTMATTSFHGCKDLPWQFTGAGLSSFFCYRHLPALGHNSDFFPRQSSSYTVNYKNMNISLRERTKRVINRRQLLDGTSQIKRSLNVNSTNMSRFIDPPFRTGNKKAAVCLQISLVLVKSCCRFLPSSKV